MLLTFVVIASSKSGLGFKTLKSRAVLVRDASDSPAKWVFEDVELPPAPPGVQLGLGALMVGAEEKFLYSFAPVEPGTHAVFVTRWKTSDVVAGDLTKPEFGNGRAWTEDLAQAEPIFVDGQTEFGLHRDAGDFVITQVDGFGGANITHRRAARPEGPWSRQTVVYQPVDRHVDGILMYSAKAHPHLKAPGGGIVLTFNTNHLDFWTMASDMNLYFPRFIVVPR